MKIAGLASVAALAAMLAGCVSPLEDTTQSMTIVTDPPGATCAFVQGSAKIGTIASTPGAVDVSKGHSDITVTCTKPGYRDAVFVAHSARYTPVLNNNAPRPDDGHTSLDQTINFLDGGTMMYDKAVKITMQKLDVAPQPAASPAKP